MSNRESTGLDWYSTSLPALVGLFGGVLLILIATAGEAWVWAGILILSGVSASIWIARSSRAARQAVHDMAVEATLAEMRSVPFYVEGLDARLWLDELCQTYTTVEQMENHLGVSTKAQVGSDVTFF